MENKQIAGRLRFLAQLMELHGENDFKVKAISAGAFKVDRLSDSLAACAQAELEKIEGIGKGLASKIKELLTTGSLTELERLISITPPEIIEMLYVKGIGPKKVRSIWKDLGIANVGELLYACYENRLIEAKGFGLKTQQDIKKFLEFRIENRSKLLYPIANRLAEECLSLLKQGIPGIEILLTGPLRRRCEYVEKIQFLTYSSFQATIFSILDRHASFSDLTLETYLKGSFQGFPLEIFFSEKKDFFINLFNTTGCESHVESVISLCRGDLLTNVCSEEDIYTHAGIPFIPPELREGFSEIEDSKSGLYKDLIVYEDLKGIIHNHTNYSDGIHSIREMALYCMELGYQYLAICDHSGSAFYARGLQVDQLVKQHLEIDELNKELAPFKILKGIESDILYNGSLDYPDEVLESFDLIIASVHSQLKMDQEKATLRLLKAIENPYTTILGHPTGRLLLSREGYPIDHQRIIDACAQYGVAIELNANPLRLDLDWRWIRYAISKGVMISINPDAHKKEAYHDMYYGLLMARKGGLRVSNCLNAFSLVELASYLNSRKFKQKT